MMQAMAIATGGALGALMRFYLSAAVYHWLGRSFPWGTLIVNVLGSLLMGLLYVWLIEKMALAPVWRGALLVGVLGAFTTFSTFSIETVLLIEQAAWWRAASNIVLSVLLCTVAAWLGVMIGRQ